MHTLASARAWAADELKHAGVESYALSSDLLLGFAIGRDRVYVLGHTEEVLPPESWERYRLWVLRRRAGEPLQYLTGEREFFGLDFRVTPSVLIPRPETEILVETAVRIARERIGPGVHFVDVGTGSGCIAVSLAYEIPESKGYATDISAAAIGIARFNAGRHKVSGQVQFVRTDLLDCFGPEPVFDLILCNPPYVALDEYDTLAGSVKDYEPHLALFGGRDGLGIFRRLAPAALPPLKRGGFFLLEIGAGQLNSVQRLMQNEGFLFEAVIEDLQGIPRCLVLRRSERSDDG